MHLDGAVTAPDARFQNAVRDADVVGVWLMRAPRAVAEDACLDVLRGCSSDRSLTLRIAATSPRNRRSVLELLQAHAYAAHCSVAMTETHGITVRWVDGIVTGSPEQLAEFLTTASPVLRRTHAQAAVAA